ncbi:MAG: SH3 domain-containing protein [Clostridia bacterium]|nr:SH3 domain-containing protein [Clostridia bacterium]
MDDDKVKYYPYDEYSEGADQAPEYQNDRYDNGGSRKGSDKSIKTLIGILVAVLLVFVILLGVFVAMKKKNANKPANTDVIATPTDAVTTTEAVTTEDQLYPVGEYVVSAEGSLRLREDHSTDAKHIMSVPSGTKLTITEVYIDNNAATNEEKFWGKTDYKGWTAWVAMAYLTKSAGSAEVTTLEGESGVTVPGTTGVGETTTKSAAGTYATGKYIVTADEFLRIREDHDVDSEAISQIDAGEEITILEIYHDTETDDSTLEYWGKVSYDGYVGWVAMHYTKPAA